MAKLPIDSDHQARMEPEGATTFKKKNLLLHWEKNLDCVYSLSLRKNLAPSLSSSIETSTTILLLHFVTGIAFLVILWSTPWERFRDLKKQRKENVGPFV